MAAPRAALCAWSLAEQPTKAFFQLVKSAGTPRYHPFLPTPSPPRQRGRIPASRRGFRPARCPGPRRVLPGPSPRLPAPGKAEGWGSASDLPTPALERVKRVFSILMCFARVSPPPFLSPRCRPPLGLKRLCLFSLHRWTTYS